MLIIQIWHGSGGNMMAWGRPSFSIYTSQIGELISATLKKKGKLKVNEKQMPQWELGPLSMRNQQWHVPNIVLL